MQELHEPLVKVGVCLYAASGVAMLVGVFAIAVTPESSDLLVVSALVNMAGLAILVLGAMLWAATLVDRLRRIIRGY